MIRLGLCCIFLKESIKFRRTTAAYLKRQSPSNARAYLSEIATSNAQALKASLAYCRNNGIGAFRINSQILPLRTHPEVGYQMTDLPGYRKLIAAFKSCGHFCKRHDIRTSFHPDQFIVLSSPNKDVVRKSIADLAYQAEVASWVNADVINVHAGGAYGNKKTALDRLEKIVRGLPVAVKSRLTLENDDRTYTPKDLLPVCERLGIPFVYDVHHHRCLPDGLRESEVTRRTIGTWNREPLFHLSSPLNGWKSTKPNSHHDYIDLTDFPKEWLDLNINITIDIEAKAKEMAILRLMKDLRSTCDIKFHPMISM